MKKTLALLLALLLFGGLPFFGFAAATTAKTPCATGETRFIKKMGWDYRTAPTPPAYADGKLYIVSGNRLFCVDAVSGETLRSVEIPGRTMYTVVPPTAENGTVYVPLDDGIVLALAAADLTPLWIYRDPLGGQALCPVVADGDLLFTAFWNGETEEANYVCLSAADEDPARTDEEKSALWTYALPGGFYRSAACVCGDWLLFGCDDGVRGSDGKSRVTALNKRTGAFASALKTAGDLRTGIVRAPDSSRFYTCSKAGFVYSFRCDPATGRLSDLRSFAAPGSVTAAPAIYGGRVYAGCQSGMEGKLLMLDAESLALLWEADLPGYPQGDFLLSTAYAEASGTVLVYGTCNRNPGVLWVLIDAPDRAAGEVNILFTPPAEAAQYCISPVIAAPDGTLYYKNDSGNLFAVESDAPQVDFVRRMLALLRRFLQGAAAALRSVRPLTQENIAEI